MLEHERPECVDKSIAQIAMEREADPFDTWLDLIAEDLDAKSAIITLYPTGTASPYAPYHAIFFQHPVSSMGLDNVSVDYKWQSKVPPGRFPGSALRGLRRVLRQVREQNEGPDP